MFKNYLRSAFRFLSRNKIYAGINVLGLSIALGVSFIILLFIINELSYNHVHKKRDRVFRVVNYYTELKQMFAGTPYIMVSTLKEEFPQIEKAVNTRSVHGTSIKLNNEYINVDWVVGTTSDIFDVFTIPLVGNTSKTGLLDDPNSMVISREIAEKFFPAQDVLGKNVTAMVNNTEQVFKITGVFENLPLNSTFRTNCMIHSTWTLGPINKAMGVENADTGWEHDFWNTWILLYDKQDEGTINSRFADIEKTHLAEGMDWKFSLQSLKDVYLRSENIANAGIQGNPGNIKIFGFIGLLIILVASTNYIILSTAVSAGRSKEIGIRKTIGASGQNIKKQMLAESILLSFLVLPIAVILMFNSLPVAEKLFQTNLQIITSNIPFYIVVYFGLAIIIGLLSGIYTSAWLSRLKVTSILKNPVLVGKRKQLTRSALISVQLIIFCSFVASTLIIRSQYNFALKNNSGYDTSDILLVDVGWDFNGYDAFLNDIKSNPMVIDAAGAMEGIPARSYTISTYPHFKDKEVKVRVEIMAIDFDYLKTLGIQVIEGRDFSREFGNDLVNSVITNESAIKQLGMEDPIGKEWGGKTIIGVVKDFNLHSIHTVVPPLRIILGEDDLNQIAIKVQPGMMSEVLPFLKESWGKITTDSPLRYSPIEEAISELYSSEKNLSTIVSIFALFTLLIASFGLFGLTLFVAKSRTKEIGIKKVFGSSQSNIVGLFVKNNLVIVTISALLSVPVTYYAMSRWLSGYAYHTGVNWWFFVVAFFLAALVVLLTIIYHSWKAARKNPVEALRYE